MSELIFEMHTAINMVLGIGFTLVLVEPTKRIMIPFYELIHHLWRKFRKTIHREDYIDMLTIIRQGLRILEALESKVLAECVAVSNLKTELRNSVDRQFSRMMIQRTFSRNQCNTVSDWLTDIFDMHHKITTAFMVLNEQQQTGVSLLSGSAQAIVMRAQARHNVRDADIRRLQDDAGVGAILESIGLMH